MGLSAQQLNLVHGVWTLVELDYLKGGFTDGIEDTANHRITPGQAGLYDIKGQVTFDQVVADKRYASAIRLNGAVYIAFDTKHAAIADYLTSPCGLLYWLSATDYVELIAASYAGVNTVDIYGVIAWTFLSVQRVR